MRRPGQKINGAAIAKAPELLELEIQRQIVEWHSAIITDTILVHIPNEGKRTQLDAAKMKPLGVVAGALDNVLIRSDGRVAWFEVKAPGGSTSSHQDYFIAKVTQLGHWAFVVRCVRDFHAVMVALGEKFNQTTRSNQLLEQSWSWPPGSVVEVPVPKAAH